MVNTSELQSSWTLPCYRTLPQICSAFAVQQKACREAFRRETPSRAAWEAEGLVAVAKRTAGDSSTPFCPYHESSVAWWWQSRCSVCAQVYAVRNAEVSSDVPNHQVRVFSTLLSQEASCSASGKAVSAHPDHRLIRYPMVTAYTARRDRMPPEDELLAASEKSPDERRMQRRARACEEFPYNLPRKGTDTNPDTFTGKTLMLKRSALDILGRVFKPLAAEKQAWHFLCSVGKIMADVDEFPKRILEKSQRYHELVKRLRDLAAENTKLLGNLNALNSLEEVEAKEQLLSAREVMKSFAVKELVKIELPPPPQFAVLARPVETKLPTLFELPTKGAVVRGDSSTIQGLFEQRSLARLAFILWRATQVKKQVAMNRLASSRRPVASPDTTEDVQRIRHDRKSEESRIRTLWQSAREQDVIEHASQTSRLHVVDDKYQGVLREMHSHFQARETHAIAEARNRSNLERVARGAEALARYEKLRRVRFMVESEIAPTAASLSVTASVPLYLDYHEIPEAVKTVEETKTLFVEVFKSFERLQNEASRPTFSRASLAIRQRARMYVFASVCRAAQDRLRIAGLRALELPRLGPRKTQYVKAQPGEIETSTSLVLEGAAEKHVSVLIRKSSKSSTSLAASAKEEPPVQEKRSPSRAFSFWRGIVE